LLLERQAGSVTATANERTLPRGGLLAALRYSISRNEFFAGLYILGCTNGLLGRIILSVNFDDWMGAVLGFDINAIVLFACFASISMLLGADKDEIQSWDLAVGIGFLVLVMLPIFALSWVAVTGLSFYVLLFANGNSDRRRGAIILLALTVPMLWSRLAFQLFAKPILDIDATLVAWLLGTDRIGNMVHFADGSGYMIVLPACSSLANLSLALLCWIAVTQWAKHKWSPADILYPMLVCASVIAVNVTRISLMGGSRSHYEAIHSQWGGIVTNSVMLGLMVGFSVLGARRELFPRA
jgi:hypothetical protein